MRTTLNVDDDILETAREVAYFRQISVGEALSMLARRGLAARVGTRRDPVSGLLVFDVKDDVAALTPEIVERAGELEDLRYAKYFGKP
ncbi:MAG: antitoxin [Acidobacteriota bacterium]|nr:antitoxin [Acidobacteriota bacterium]